MTPVTVLRQVVYVVALLSTFGLHCVCGEPQSFQPQGNVEKCVGDPVTFTCTVVDDDISMGGEITVWRASGEVNCEGNIIHSSRLFGDCDDADPNVDNPFFINGTVQNTNCVVFELSAAVATVDMNNTLIECYNSTTVNPASLVGNSRLFVEDNLPPPVITDIIIDVDTECVVVLLQPQGNNACFDNFTVETVGSTMTNTSVSNNITICGLDLCIDTFGFTVRSNAEDFNSMEKQTSNESFPSPGSVTMNSIAYTPTNLMVEVLWENEESFIDELLDVNVRIITNSSADASCTANLSENRFRCTPSYSNFLEETITFTVMFQLASCMMARSSAPVPFPMIIAGSTVDVTNTRATVTLTYVSGSGINVAPGFRLMVTIMQGVSVEETISQTFRLSDTRYEINNLNRNTSYTYDIRIESGTDSSIVIGRDSGSFTTDMDPPPSETSSVPIWIVAPIVIGVLLLLATGSLGGICIYKQRIKHSPSDSQQPGPLYEDMSSHEKSRDIALEENVAYGPVTPQQPAVMYEEVSAQPEKIEMSGNVAYGQISH